VLVADDHHVVRHGLLVLLDSERGVEVVGEAAETAGLLREVFALHPNVLALDLRLPGCSVCDTIRRLRAELPETEIVVLTMDESAQVARRALDAGAIGVVLKDRADTELPGAIRCAAEAREYVSSRLAGCASTSTTPAG
jgi:DNA-binding NarL/FixJ family response regulator